MAIDQSTDSSTFRRPTFLSRAVGRMARLLLYGLLVFAVVVVGSFGLWSQVEVDTGVAACLEVAASLGRGVEAGICPIDRADYMIYSQGIQASLGVSLSASIINGGDPRYGWDWAIQERRQSGTTLADLASARGTDCDSCNGTLASVLGASSGH